jgi:hypothetical protein
MIESSLATLLLATPASLGESLPDLGARPGAAAPDHFPVPGVAEGWVRFGLLLPAGAARSLTASRTRTHSGCRPGSAGESSPASQVTPR